MASIYASTNTTSSSTSSIRGYGGLASGLDTDALIEAMTSGTQAKIDKQNQAKDKLEWEQTAMRDIIDEMVNFADKYTSTMTSSSNLFTSAFWGRTDVSAVGTNSDKLTVSGSASSSETFSVLGVQQLAKNATSMTAGTASVGTLETAAINFDSDYNVSELGGKMLNFTVGNDQYYLVLSESGDYSSPESIVNELNEQMKEVDITITGSDSSKTLADFIQFSQEDGKLSVEVVSNDGGNEISLDGGSALELLGFKAEGEKWEKTVISNDADGKLGSITAGSVIEEPDKSSFADLVSGGSITFNYNGTTKKITLDDAETNPDAYASLDGFKAMLQDKLDKAFGANRIEVGTTDEGGLSFATVRNGGVDNSSVLTITAASNGLLGKDGALGISAGASNRLNLNASIAESGLALGASITFTKPDDAAEDAVGTASMTINGTKIEFSETDSIKDIITRINNSDAGVTVSYSSLSDKFILESKVEGASGQITFDDENARNFFGGSFNETAGQDAIITVKQGSGEAVNIYRGSNSFTMDGLTITVKDEFGTYDASGQIEEATADAVTFESNVKVDNIVTTVKEMIEGYNKIIENVNKQLTTKPNRDYSPLTTAQKEEMSEKQIELWEEKAKEGLLYGDSNLRSLSSSMRFTISSGLSAELSKIGISVSTSYSDNGKIEFDEEKFKAALESDPENVKKLFTQDTKNGDAVNGFATNIKNVMNTYVRTIGATKGILIEYAGSSKAPASITNNYLYNQMNSIEKLLDSLSDRLENEKDRYISKFSSLETYINQMNYQSSMLMSMSGY